MKIGCISDDGIGLLVDRFHAKVRVDPLLARFSNVSFSRCGPICLANGATARRQLIKQNESV